LHENFSHSFVYYNNNNIFLFKFNSLENIYTKIYIYILYIFSISLIYFQIPYLNNAY